MTPEEKGDHKENCFKRFLFSTHNALLPNNALCDDDILLQGKYGLEKKFISITRIFPQKFEKNLYFVPFALQLRQWGFEVVHIKSFCNFRKKKHLMEANKLKSATTCGKFSVAIRDQSRFSTSWAFPNLIA